MAATIARAQGFTKGGSIQAKVATRLGNGQAHAEANTYSTFASVHIHAGGAGSFRLVRGGEIIYKYEWPSEDVDKMADRLQGEDP